MKGRTVIFSDLDGSLLDSRTYSFSPATGALALVRERGVPLVFCSSKTRAELESWRTLLGNSDPFISENGGGVFIPGGYFSGPAEGEERGPYRVIILGAAYREVRHVFADVRERLRVPVRGFGDMTVREVANLTGLPPAEAKLARQRDFDEPFVFDGPPDDRFLRGIEAAGLRWTQGRYYHILGDHDKGRAVAVLRRLYERGGPVTTVGLGDSLNDLPLLQAVDRPVLIRREDGTHDPRVSVPGMVRTEGIGPAGWNEAVMRILSDA